MSVKVLIPWAGSSQHRRRALEWVLGHLADYSVDIAPGQTDPWIKAQALMPAVQETRAEIVVLHDADCFSVGLPGAIQAVQEGSAWAIPHWDVHRLSERGTDAVLRGDDWAQQELAQPKYTAMAGGGVLVARRDTLLQIPIDPRFVGWGSEDESHAMALWCLLGAPYRSNEPLIHLWHEPQWRISRRQGSQASWELRNRYARARRDPELMCKLLSEAKDALRSLDITSDNRQPV